MGTKKDSVLPERISPHAAIVVLHWSQPEAQLLSLGQFVQMLFCVAILSFVPTFCVLLRAPKFVQLNAQFSIIFYSSLESVGA